MRQVRGRLFTVLCIAVLPIAASAVTTSENFKNIKQALYPSWQRWNNMCTPTVVPSPVTEATAKVYAEQYQRYVGCLAFTYSKVEERTDAEPLVNPDIWKGLSPEQQRELNAGLRQANQAIAAQLQAARAAEEIKAKPVIDAITALRAREQAKAEAPPTQDTGASEARVRACARRYQKLDDGDSDLASEKEDIKGQQLRQTMMETRLIGMRVTASASDYNRAVSIYQNDSQKLADRINRYNARLRTSKAAWSSYEDDCDDLHFSARTRDAICDGGDYPAYCNGIGKRK